MALNGAKVTAYKNRGGDFSCFIPNNTWQGRSS